MCAQPSTSYPFVSVIMPCSDEVKFIRGAVETLLASNYPKERLEILIILDAKSSDGTRDIICELMRTNSVIKLLTNPRTFVPFAMNIGIRAAKGDVIIRVDAHSEYPPDYVNKCVEYLEKTGAWCVGGPFYNKPASNSFVARMIAAVLSSPFLVADAKFRTERKPMYVETVPFGAFRKEVFEKIGLYDERLIRHQDYELCKRIIKYGGKIFMTPEIKNFYYPRSTLKELFYMARYSGLWDAFSHKLCAYSFAWRHFIPAPFFLGVFACLALIALGLLMNAKILYIIGLMPFLTYFIAGLVFSINICLREKLNFLAVFLLPVICFLYHFNFGYGAIKGWFLILTGRWGKYIPRVFPQ